WITQLIPCPPGSCSGSAWHPRCMRDSSEWPTCWMNHRRVCIRPKKHTLSKLFARFIAKGNSVLLVEHDMSLVAQADWVVDVGPKAGVEESITARFVHPWPLHLNDAPRHPARSALKFVGITARNIVDQDVTIPLGQFTAVTGVSGSGKSTLVTHVIGRHVQNA